MEQLSDDAILYAADRHGVYIPKYFADSLDLSMVTLSGLPSSHIAECMELIGRGPDEEYYWHAWDDLLANLIVTSNATGKAYYLYQDGDLWLVPTN